MLIKEWMAKDVLTVDEGTSVMRATRIMKENNIRRLPVVASGRLIGIVTDRDLKDASPSKSTSLDIHELYYLLSEMKVKDVMTPDPVTIQGEESLEKAAMIMLDNKISGILVVDAGGQLAGLLSETDVLRGFIHMTGIKDGAIQYVFDLPDREGSVSQVVKVIRANNARVVSVLTSFEETEPGMKRVAMRVTPEEGAHKVEELSRQLMEAFTVVYHGQDEVKNLPRKRGA